MNWIDRNVHSSLAAMATFRFSELVFHRPVTPHHTASVVLLVLFLRFICSVRKLLILISDVFPFCLTSNDVKFQMYFYFSLVLWFCWCGFLFLLRLEDLTFIVKTELNVWNRMCNVDYGLEKPNQASRRFTIALATSLLMKNQLISVCAYCVESFRSFDRICSQKESAQTTQYAVNCWWWDSNEYKLKVRWQSTSN